MKRSFVSCFVICGVFFVAEFAVELAVEPNSTLSQVVGVLSAQSPLDEEPEDPRPERKLLPITIEFFNQNEKITAAIEEEEDFEKARELLDRSLERSRRWNERELAFFHRRYANLGQILSDYDLMLEHMKKLLEYREFVKYFVEEEALWLVATLYASHYEDYETALDYIQQWLDLKNDWEEGSKRYAYIGGIYTLMDDYTKTVEWITRAIERAGEEETDVEEGWWVQLLQAYTRLSEENENNPAERDRYLELALDLAKFLVYNYRHNVEYWSVLSNIFYERGTVSNDPIVQEDASWAYTFESAYHMGLLSEEKEVLRVISGMQNQAAYSRAARVYEEGFDSEILERNFENLNNYGHMLYMSTDVSKAASAYEEAVTYKDDATVLHSLASLYQLTEDFSKCITYATRALNATEGELRKPEQVRFLKGVCQFFNDDLDGSEETMEELRTEISSDTEDEGLERLRKSAGQYIDLINNERERIKWKEYVEEQWRLYLEEKRQS